MKPEPDCLEELKYTCRRHSANLSIVSRDDIRPYEFSVDRTSFIYENENLHSDSREFFNWIMQGWHLGSQITK